MTLPADDSAGSSHCAINNILKTLFNMNSYKKFLWMELIGLDNTQSDCGVSKYLDSLDFTPDTISIFMWGPDFLHHHTGLDSDGLFPPDVGAYMDFWYPGAKSSNPPWSKFQLKKVVDGFHARNVKVFFSIFPRSLNNHFHREWLSDHPEVRLTTSGIPTDPNTINPLRRFNSGAYYEDFIIGKAREALIDYGFDGWHLADGYNHPWCQLCHGDYSDDMVDQFLTDANPELPPWLEKTVGNDQDAIDRRAKLIWNKLRRQWINFYCRRNERFLSKICDMAHAAGKEVSANTCWTRDPVEAVYRYGIDYRKFKKVGIDTLVVETCSAAGELESARSRASFSVPFFHVLQSTSLLTGVAADSELLFNQCVQDTTEGWSTLHHAPAFLEREIMAYPNLFRFDKSGKMHRCFSGFQICLATGIESHEWRWLKNKWDIAYEFMPSAIDSAALVWSEALMDAELDYYLETRNSLNANILYNLYSAGAPLHTVIPIKAVDKVDMPLVSIHPGLLPEAEFSKLFNERKSPLILIGEMPPDLPEADFAFAEGDMELRIYGATPDVEVTALEKVTVKLPEDIMDIPEPASFFKEQFYLPLSPEFYRLATSCIEKVAGPNIELDDPGRPDSAFFKFKVLRSKDKRIRVFITNDDMHYAFGNMCLPYEVKTMDIVNNFRGRPMFIEERFDKKPGSMTFMVIAPKGVAVIDMKE
ncbi:MAG: hypothetical protein E7053_03005 [Lentisphaerae bacterium]|nr:hypothetical protein [Lentisphaerota bacterium]